MAKRPAEEQLTKETASVADGNTATSFTLYGLGVSTSTQRVLLTAFELGIAYDLQRIDVMKGADNRTADYLAVNPFARVPAAVIDGVTVYESRAIARMLAEKHQSKGSPLMPTDFRGRVLFEQWASLEATTYAPKVDTINMALVWGPMFGAPADEQKAKDTYKAFQPLLALLDTQLAANQYITGELSLVDLFLAPDWAHLLTTPEGKQLQEQYKNVAAWWERLSARPSWQKLLPLVDDGKPGSA